MPNSDAIRVNMSAFPGPPNSRWFDPVHGEYRSSAARIKNRGIHSFVPPAQGEWVLLLAK